MGDFEGRVVVITGGSNGIGAELVRCFACEGAKVVLNYYSDTESAEKIQAECHELGQVVVLQKGSITDGQFVKEMFNDTVKQFGKVDILINNAGITKDGFLMTSKFEDIKKVIDTNLVGSINVSKLVIPHMIQNKGGKIINMSSVAAIKGTIGQSIYSSTKAALVGFTQSLALELARFNIQVNAVAPGFIDTKMTQKLGSKVQEEYIKAIPIKRFGECEEVAQLVKFLCSDHAQYIVGQTIVIDGGLTC